jgi:N-methylhydantoinase A
VTDADVVLGRIDPGSFSGGRMPLDGAAAKASIVKNVGTRLDLSAVHAALGISEIVDENMASAARVHAIESGKDIRTRTMVAFGGAAPLHAARVAEKLGIDRVLIPANAGVGSAVGLLRAPVAYEIVRSRLVRLNNFDSAIANTVFAEMRSEAEDIVRRGEPRAKLTERRAVFMRYRGQGHEISVDLPVREFTSTDVPAITALFEEAYRRLYSRPIPGVEIEILSWVLSLSAPSEGKLATASKLRPVQPKPAAQRQVFDPASGVFIDTPVYERTHVSPGARIKGPAVITEDDTTTIVSPSFDANIDQFGYIELIRRDK